MWIASSKASEEKALKRCISLESEYKAAEQAYVTLILIHSHGMFMSVSLFRMPY
jgi:hypothetical protein